MNRIQSATQDARSMLNALGIGQFNASAVIPYLFVTPANTDPDMPAVRLLVQGLQRGLSRMGAKVAPTGLIDEATARELDRLTGTDWRGMMWLTIYQTVINAIGHGRKLGPVKAGPVPELEMVGFLPDLPSPPPALTLAAVGLAAWYFLWRKR